MGGERHGGHQSLHLEEIELFGTIPQGVGDLCVTCVGTTPAKLLPDQEERRDSDAFELV